MHQRNHPWELEGTSGDSGSAPGLDARQGGRATEPGMKCYSRHVEGLQVLELVAACR